MKTRYFYSRATRISHSLGAALEGLICFGPEDGKQQTFVLLDEWVPKKLILKREEALAELAGDILSAEAGYITDFVWWSGLKVTDARIGLKAAASQLEQITIGDQTYWMPPKASGISKTIQRMYLLPGFDEYLLGYKDRMRFLMVNIHDISCLATMGCSVRQL